MWPLHLSIALVNFCKCWVHLSGRDLYVCIVESTCQQHLRKYGIYRKPTVSGSAICEAGMQTNMQRDKKMCVYVRAVGRATRFSICGNSQNGGAVQGGC